MNKVVGGDMPAAIWKDFVARASATLAKKRSPQTAGGPQTTASIQAPAGDSPTGAVLRGRPEVIDTGTLEFRDKTIRLIGIEGERGRAARDLARFLRRREVTCEPAGGDLHRCRVEGQDLSETILLAGGARATADAPPELLAAEETARSSRAGLWRRWR
jgi:endonuclease YncB( thermonuclease family)